MLDLQGNAVQVPLTWAVQPPHKIAYHLFGMSTVLWNARIDEPAKGHRGWETAIYDSYDLCAVARLYDAGPGGLSRPKFVADMIDKHPWGSQ
jgi:hypothetical protein